MTPGNSSEIEDVKPQTRDRLPSAFALDPDNAIIGSLTKPHYFSVIEHSDLIGPGSRFLIFTRLAATDSSCRVQHGDRV